MQRRLLVVTVLACLGACGGSSTSSGSGGSPTTPTTTLPPAGGPTITINASGVVEPKQLEIQVGSRVIFTNDDRVPHEMSSDPHPSHETCPPINEVSALAPGQSRQTGVFTIARSCGFHDHGQSENTSLQGTIVIR